MGVPAEDELADALRGAQREVEQLERRILRRDRASHELLDVLCRRAAALEAESAELERRAAHHRLELSALEAGSAEALSSGSALRLMLLAGLVAAGSEGLASLADTGALLGVTALLGLLTFLGGYFRG